MSGINNFFQKNSSRLFILLYFVAYFLPLINRKLWIPDEVRYAEISREMISSGDWVVPHLLGLNYFEKPVAGYWLNNISQLVFGQTHFAVRFASAFCTGLSGLLIFWFALQLFQNKKKAFAAAACYLSCLEAYCVGTYSILDGMLAFWLSLTLVAFYWSLQADSRQKKLIGYGVMGMAAGLSFLTKGFVAFAVPIIVALPYLVYQRKLSELRYLWIALLTMLLVSLPWTIAVHLRAPDYWHYFFWVEHVQRFTSENAQHKAPFWYYFPVMLIGCLPWLGLVPAALRQSWNELPLRPAVIFLLCWLIIPLVFFSIAKGKLPAYILPVFAPLAILLGHGIVELIEKQQWRSIRINSWVNIVFGGLFALVLILLSTGVTGRTQLYQAEDTPALLLAIAIFIAWCIMGLASLYRPAHTLWLSALCPLAFGLLLGWSIPKSTIYAKLPEVFIAENQPILNQSRFVLSNSSGLAVSLAWELKRNDIRLYINRGELDYGLKTTSQTDKSLSQTDFPQWLAKARVEGDVSLVLLHDPDELPESPPEADEVITQQRLTLFIYHQQAHL